MPWFVNIVMLVVIFIVLKAKTGKAAPFVIPTVVVSGLVETPESVIQTTELPCYARIDAVDCYNCKTSSDDDDDFCGDPFNSTHPDVTKILCGKAEYCTKWVVVLKSGAKQTTRTCSNKINLNLKMYTVCMSESGSDTGRLCFCEKELCNAATSLSALTSLWTYVIVCVLVTLPLAGLNLDCHWLLRNS